MEKQSPYKALIWVQFPAGVPLGFIVWEIDMSQSPLQGTSSLHTRAGAFDATRRQPISKTGGLQPGWDPNRWEPTKQQALRALKNRKWSQTTNAAVTEGRKALIEAILEAIKKTPGSHGLGGYKIKTPALNTSEPPDMEGSVGFSGPCGRTAHAY